MLIYVEHAFEHFNVSKTWPYTVLCTFFHIVHVALFRCILYRCTITCISKYLSCHTFYRLWFCGISSTGMGHTTINCGPQNGGCKATMSTERPNTSRLDQNWRTRCVKTYNISLGGTNIRLPSILDDFGVHQGTTLLTRSATWRNRKSDSLKPKDLAESRVSCTGSLPCTLW